MKPHKRTANPLPLLCTPLGFFSCGLFLRLIRRPYSHSCQRELLAKVKIYVGPQDTYMSNLRLLFLCFMSFTYVALMKIQGQTGISCVVVRPDNMTSYIVKETPNRDLL